LELEKEMTREEAKEEPELKENCLILTTEGKDSMRMQFHFYYFSFHFS